MSIRRVSIIAAALTVVVVGAAGVYLWRARAAERVRPGETVSLRDGQLTFRMPAGWQREECRAADNGCVEFRPPDGATGKIDQDPGVPTEAPIFDPAHPPTDFVKPRTGGDELGDRIVVIVSSPDPNAAEADIGRGLLYPGAFAGNGVTYFTVDGVRFAQAHLEAITLVLAVLPNDDDVRIACSEQAKPDIVRAGCQVVIDSLHVRT